MKKRSGVLAQKLGMTTLFLDSGEACPVTLFSFKDCCVIDHKKISDHEVALQVASGITKKATKPLRGIFAKAGVSPRKKICEFRVSSEYVLPIGTTLLPDHFGLLSYVDITGVTIGRGFAGGMKRHHFKGLRATHGVSVSHRSHGSTGNRKDPGKVFKGKKMAGHMGCQKVTMQNLKVMDYDTERGILVVKGSVPGFEGGWVQIKDSIKRQSLVQSLNE